MKNKQICAFAAGLLALLMLMSGLRLLCASAADLQGERAAYLAAQCGGQTLQQWVEGGITDSAGSSAPEWHVLALRASGEALDFSAYRAAVTDLLETHPPAGATAKQRCALALIAASDGIPGICETVLRETAGQQGIMSWVFALHLVNQGVRGDQTNAEIAAELLKRQCTDGGWSLSGVSGDPDVTAMTVQALAPYRDVPELADAIGRALTFLSGKQLSDGGFASYGAENPESAAQVWIALCTLGLDPLTDTRFIKNGHTLADAVALFSRGAGQYAHTTDGDINAAASLQVFLAYTAQACLQSGRSLYLLRGNPAWQGQAQIQTQLQTQIQTTGPVQTDASVTQRSTQTVPQTRQTASATTQSGPVQSDITTENSVSAVISEISTTEVLSQTQTDAASTESAAQTHTASRTETETTADIVQSTVTTAAPPAAKYPYRLPLTAAIWGVFLVSAVILWVRKRRSAKSFLTLAGICGVLTVLVWVIRVESPAQYYTEQSRGGGGTVTMEIRCDVILGLPGSERFPADGVILPETAFAIDENENALTLLYDAVRANSLQIEVDGVSGDVVETAYVRGIASLYEFDFGDLSGWTYLVNGERPSVGCGAYTLHDGDKVVWAYTVSL